MSRWIERVGAVASIVALLIVVAQGWSTVREALYPIGVIASLGVGAVAGWLLMLLGRRSKPPAIRGAGEEQHDKWVVSEVRATVGRERVEWLREHDLGNAWRREWVDPFYALERLDDVEHDPLDDELRAAFRRLISATHEFAAGLGQYSWPELVYKPGEDWRCIGEIDWSEGAEARHESERRWQERRTRLNTSADEVVAAYDGDDRGGV